MGTDKDLSDLETAGVISIELNHGKAAQLLIDIPEKQRIIKPAKPIFCRAFQILAGDTHLAAAVARFRFEQQVKDRQQKIMATQEELTKLATIRVETPFPWYKFALLSYWFSMNPWYVAAPQPVRTRTTYLLAKLNTLQSELQLAEAKIKEANFVLQRPYCGRS